MEIETLTAMNGALLSLLIIKVIALMIFLFTIVGFVIYLAGIAWLCYKEMRQPASRPIKPTTESPNLDEDAQLAVLAFSEKA